MQIAQTIDVTGGFMPGTIRDVDFTVAVHNAVLAGGIFEVVARPGIGTLAFLRDAVAETRTPYEYMYAPLTDFTPVPPVGFAASENPVLERIYGALDRSPSGQINLIIDDIDRMPLRQMDALESLLADLPTGVQAVGLLRTNTN